jgi:poly(3-hydroxybutyrate) depolymerase
MTMLVVLLLATAIDLPLRSLEAMGERQEPRGSGRAARGRRGLGALTTPLAREVIMEFLSAQMLPARSRILAGALALLFSSQTMCAGDEFVIEHQGIARHYLMHRPSNNEDLPRPLVIYLHGLRPASWKNRTQPKIDTAADRGDFVAVYPEAVGHAH